MTGGAVLSEDALYRYSLWRSWQGDQPRVLFLCLNPSTADAEVDDPTVRKMVGFAQRWGFGSMEVVNLFAWRATKPQALRNAIDPEGPLNDSSIADAFERASRLVLAWGSHAEIRDMLDRRAFVIRRRYNLQNHPTKVGHLGLCKDGHPRHPLMLAYATPFTPYSATKE